jgi:hypothetical protein
LSTTCTHPGCTPNWLERGKKFKCPCHGSGYKITVVNFEGPAPRPLERWGISIAEDGQLLVDKSKKLPGSLNVDDRVSLERPTYESSVVAKDLIDGGDLVAWQHTGDRHNGCVCTGSG